MCVCEWVYVYIHNVQNIYLIPMLVRSIVLHYNYYFKLYLKCEIANR